MLLFASILVSLAIANCAPLNENDPMEGKTIKIEVFNLKIKIYIFFKKGHILVGICSEFMTLAYFF